MQKAWGKPFPQCAARFLSDNLSKELSTSSLDLRSQRHVPQLLIQLKNTFDFSGATHKQIKLLWCSGRGPGKRQALIQRRLLLLWSWHQHLFPPTLLLQIFTSLGHIAATSHSACKAFCSTGASGFLSRVSPALQASASGTCTVQ